MESEKEIWKEVDGYNGIYFVSNLGRIKSVDHYINSRWGCVLKKGRFLKFRKSIKGYIQVSFSLKGKRFNTGVHRVIARAFIPNPLNKPQINHINGIKDDNRLVNLEWCTNRENQIHAVKNKLVNLNYGERHHNSKLTNKEVVKVRELHKIGFTNIELAKDYKISATAMSNILRRKTYNNI